VARRMIFWAENYRLKFQSSGLALIETVLTEFDCGFEGKISLSLGCID